jgi:hypothetical protein
LPEAHDPLRRLELRHRVVEHSPRRIAVEQGGGDLASLRTSKVETRRIPPGNHATYAALIAALLQNSWNLICNRRMTAGDFLHADADTDHGDLRTDEGARVLLVVPAETYL